MSQLHSGIFAAALAFSAGASLGLCGLALLHLQVQRLANGASVPAVLALALGRMVLLGLVLGLAARAGAAPLLGAGLGCIVSRTVLTGLMRRLP